MSLAAQPRGPLWDVPLGHSYSQCSTAAPDRPKHTETRSVTAGTDRQLPSTFDWSGFEKVPDWFPHNHPKATVMEFNKELLTLPKCMIEFGKFSHVLVWICFPMQLDIHRMKKSMWFMWYRTNYTSPKKAFIRKATSLCFVENQCDYQMELFEPKQGCD